VEACDTFLIKNGLGMYDPILEKLVKPQIFLSELFDFDQISHFKTTKTSLCRFLKKPIFPANFFKLGLPE